VRSLGAVDRGLDVGFLSREPRVSEFGTLSAMENVSSRRIF
jgi:hypothetical protein